MSKTKLNIIQPSLGLVRLSDGNLLWRANAVHDRHVATIRHIPAHLSAWATSRPPSMPIRPPSQPLSMEASLLLWSATNGGGGDHHAAPPRALRRGRVARTICQHFSPAVPAGFDGAPDSQPLSPPSAIRIDQGNTGQLLVRIEPVARARSLRIPVRQGSSGRFDADSWTKVTAASTRPRFRSTASARRDIHLPARAFGQLGFSDWSNSVERMCI